MSGIGGKAENICSQRVFPVLTHNGHWPLYGVFFVKELARAAKLSFVGFLVRSQSPFLRPDLRIADVDARKICTRLAVTPTLRHASPLPGHTMTASSTTAR